MLSTTNGSPAIVSACRDLDRVLIGSLLNLDATVGAIPPRGRLVIVCAGTDGAPALEDVYMAGRIIERLGGEHSDSARIAVRVAASYAEPRQALPDSADAGQLVKTGQAHDIAWCARVDDRPGARGDLGGGVRRRMLAPQIHNQNPMH